MYVVVAQGKLAGPAEAAGQRLRDHVAPLLHGRPGFKGFGAFADGAGALHAFGIFDSREAAKDARDRVAEWARTQGRDLSAMAPDVAGGEAVFHDVSNPSDQQKDRHRPLFAVIRTYHGLPGQAEAMHSAVSRHTVPAIEHAPGFRGFYSFRDDRNPDRAISITLFDTREDAMRVHEAVLGIMREKLGEMAYDMPDAAMGETLVLVAG